MSASTNVNQMTVVHKDSGGVTAAFPDVCKTPTSGGPIPIPYPNISQSKDTAMGSKSVAVDGNPIMLKGSNFSTSTGDEPGSVGGMASGTTKGKAEFINYSFDVKVEGKNVPRLLDPMITNKASAANTPPATEIQPPLVIVPVPEGDIEPLESLRIFFGNEFVEVIRNRYEMPKLSTKHKLSGPENKTELTNGSNIVYLDIKKGKYRLELELDVKQKPFKQDK